MESRLSLGQISVLAVFVHVSLLAATALGAEPPAATLQEQLTRARADNDQAAIVEICRRQMEKPGHAAVELLTTGFHAQVEVADYTRAGQTLDQLEKLSVPAGRVEDLRGDLARAADRPAEEAITHWRKALEAGSSDRAAINGKIADAYDADDDWAKAAEAFGVFLRDHPDHAARRARLAVCLLNNGQPTDADKEMATANRLDAADATVKALAPIFDRLRPQLAALKTLEARIASPSTPKGIEWSFNVRAGANTLEAACLDAALILYRAGAYDAALVPLEQAGETLGNRSLAVLLLQGQCLWRLNRAEEAAALRVAKIADDKWFDDRTRFDRLRAADTPGPAGLTARQHAARAGVLLDAGQPALVLDEARAAVDLGEKTGPLAAESQIVLAAALYQNDRSSEALIAARRATEIDPRNADGWALRAHLEEDARADFPAAVDSLTRALALRNDPLWLRRRESCLRTLGRLAEADRDARHLPASAQGN